ncbi:unnamed protein product [Oikopleura dioica]|uniref:Uncharacterized protein n=1 Tax=Oikopleura dioica TaxID=34765 RepID=E4Y8H4_OIKDI|nr:unnamed protein product [Oikopleura dioica]
MIGIIYVEKIRNYAFLELLFKVGANQLENFNNLALEASLSDSILLKNECTRKSRKDEHGTCEIFRFFRVLRLKTIYLTQINVKV